MPQFLLIVPVQTPFMGLSDSEVPDEKQYQSQIQEYHFPPGDIGHALPQARSAHSPLCRWWLQVAPKQASTQRAGGRSSFLTNTLRFERLLDPGGRLEQPQLIHHHKEGRERLSHHERSAMPL